MGKMILLALIAAVAVAAQFTMLGTQTNRFSADEISIEWSDRENQKHHWRKVYFKGNRINLTGTGKFTIVDVDGKQLVLTLKDGRFYH